MDEHEQKPADFRHWAIVEIMGHQQLAGYVSERTIAGAPMLQVDVPQCPASEWSEAVAAFTTFIGGSSIYRLTPTTEEVARKAVEQFRKRPITCVQLPAAPALPAPDAQVATAAERDVCPDCGIYTGDPGLCPECRDDEGGLP